MFDKLSFNNQLLGNKKNVKKAKTNCINKLVHKIRKLKKLEEKNPEDKKIKYKIIKTADQIQCIKKLKSIEILKKALLNDKNPSIILTNGLSLPEEIAEALLYSHKIIKNIVENLKVIFEFNSSNQNWKDEIQELSKKQQKLTKIKSIQEKIEARQIQKELKRKRTEWLEENSTKNLIPASDDHSSTEWLEEKVEINRKSKIETRKSDKIKLKAQKDSITSFVNHKSDGEEFLETVKSIDPFFITSTGDNYLSTVIIDRVEPEYHADGMIRKERRAIQKHEKRFNGNKKKNWPKNKMHLIESDKKLNNRTRENDRNNNSENLGKLHPSWAAKQKLKGLKEFSGKKIIFDNENSDGNVKTNSKLSSSWTKNSKENENFSRKKITDNIKIFDIKNQTEDTEKLHPSWAAKQKLKPKISEFKGTKIKFDEN